MVVTEVVPMRVSCGGGGGGSFVGILLVSGCCGLHIGCVKSNGSGNGATMKEVVKVSWNCSF